MAELKLLPATVGHARLAPKKNRFAYKVFYVALPITRAPSHTAVIPEHLPRLFSLNRWNVLSLRSRDYAGQESWYDFITGQLARAGIPFDDSYHITLLTHPRLFGYAFNPISFWLVRDAQGGLKAVFCRVTNTFKQTHNYLLAKADATAILPEDILTSQKNLYVSPYTKPEGHYEFSFTVTKERYKVVINYFDAAGTHILNTYMGGMFEPLTSATITKAVLRYPLMTMLVVARIHWQAVKLFFKGVPPTLKSRQKAYQNERTTISKK